MCVDVRKWPIMWPNVEFIKGDLLQSNISFDSFDVITCISTIEHFGLGRYGDKEDVDGDMKGMELLKRYLKPNGLMILTVPFGRPAIAFPAHRIYDKSRFSRLISGFKILDKEFFGPIERCDVYRPCSEKETYPVDTRGGYAIICALLEKGKFHEEE
ncbi:MAG: hypothetical protein DDT40_01721 [candidate division WS2 bacterium]|nr:hypothetical protein [Candidatus Psychracetigena formicireducens]